MNPVFTLLPAASAAFVMFFSSMPLDDFDTSIGYGARSPAQKSASGPTNDEQSVEATFYAPGQISFAPVPGASSYALFSGVEFGMFQGQKPWIENQLREMNNRPQAPMNETFSLPSLPEIAQAIQIEGQKIRVAFQETSAADGTVPAPLGSATAAQKADSDAKSDAAEDKDKDAEDNEEKYVERKGGRVTLTKALIFRGWEKNPVRKKATEQAPDSEEPSADLMSAAISSPEPINAPPLAIPPATPVEP